MYFSGEVVACGSFNDLLFWRFGKFDFRFETKNAGHIFQKRLALEMVNWVVNSTTTEFSPQMFTF